MSSRPQLILNCQNGHITKTYDLEKYGFNDDTPPGPQKGPFICVQCLDAAVLHGHYYVSVIQRHFFTTKIIATCSCGEITESEPYMGSPSKPCKKYRNAEEQ